MKFKIFAFVFLFGASQALDAKQKLLLANANDNFGLLLLKSLETIEHKSPVASRQNIFISPYSISSVLAMLLAGAVNQTHAQLNSALGFANFHLSNSEIFESYREIRIDSELARHSKGSDNLLNIANAIAIQKSFPVLEPFINNITAYFESRIFAEDFKSSGSKATLDINTWVNEQTHGRIPKLVDGDLDPNTVLVLLNAIYFKGTWKTQFSKDATMVDMFALDDDHRIEVPMMSVKSHFSYAELTDGQLIELPYQDESMAMYIFLPYQWKHISELSSAALAANLTEQFSQLYRETVTIHLPKFRFEHTYQLSSVLRELGIQDAFSPTKADFSNIDGSKDLHLSEIIHKTFIEVNEEGSEAAAVTGGIIGGHGPSPPPPEIHFRVDHPFLFSIRDKKHSVTLFSGIVNKP